MINQVIAQRYEILEAIGDGLLFQAFRARDREMNRIVALKLLRDFWRDRPEILRPLRQGVGEVLALSHPHIARLYDVGESPSPVGSESETIFYTTEEYVRGIDLKERIRRVAPFSLTAAVDVAIAMVEALSAAHVRGVVHGQVSPHHVLIGPEGQIKLTGFGMADLQPLLTEPDALVRVLPYSAPDLVTDSGAPAVTASGDLYAVGVVLYEMLTGEMPYGVAGGPIQIALRQARDPIPSPRAINAGVPRALEGVVQKALGKRPEERYGTDDEMLQDLRAIRDALRYGKPLSWSPLDRHAPEPVGSAAGASGAAVSAASAVGGAAVSERVFEPDEEEATVAAGTQAKRRPRSARAESGGPNHASGGGSGGRWLTALNLFLLLLVIGGVGALVWIVKDVLQPAREVVVPNLVGKTLTDAEDLSRQQKFTVIKVDEQYREPDKEPAGVIYQMRPEAGRRIKEGKQVSVWVSKGPRLVEVPDVRDVALEKARRVIEQAGLRVGKLDAEYDPITAKGNVLRQEPTSLENRPRGTRVNLVLSRGEEPPPEPEVPLEPDAGPVEDLRPETPRSENSPEDNRTRTFTIRYPKNGALPPEGAPHRIRIDVVDRDGIRTVYEEVLESGKRVEQDVEAVGKNITIRLYDNDELRTELTR